MSEKEFKQYDDFYSVSKDGDVFSTHSGRCLKHYIDHDGYHRVDIHGAHMKVHKIVYMVWGGNIPDGMQINHIDDNKDNNNIQNLYLGTQSENISDCISNNHRCGNVLSITVLNKETGETEWYETVKDFLLTTGHGAQNGSIAKIRKKKWFAKKYDILDMERCRDYRTLAKAKQVE